MIVERAVAAAAHAGGGTWVAAFGFGEEFLGVGFVVLAFFNATLAITKPRATSIKPKRASKLSFVLIS